MAIIFGECFQARCIERINILIGDFPLVFVNTAGIIIESFSRLIYVCRTFSDLNTKIINLIKHI